MIGRTINRMVGMANKAARRNARGIVTSEWAEVEAPPPYDPWANVPEELREKRVEVLPDGTVMETYVDTVETLEARRRAAAQPAPEPEPEEPAPLPKPRARGRKKGEADPSPYASYPMPGHGAR